MRRPRSTVDGRHTDDELWALVAAFAHHQILSGMATPDAIRRNDLVVGKRNRVCPPAIARIWVRIC